jgi:hypothetical protein
LFSFLSKSLLFTTTVVDYTRVAMLSDKIWITRKTRIYTEQRLQQNANITQVLTVFFSLALVSLSMWNLKSNDPQFNIILVFASIFVLVLSVYLAAQKYTERSLAMRNCYIKLDEMYSRAKRAETSNDERTLENLESEYASLIINIENHSEYDYLCLRYSLKDNKDTTLPPFTKLDHMQYFWEITWRKSLTVILFTISLLLMVCIWL